MIARMRWTLCCARLSAQTDRRLRGRCCRRWFGPGHGGAGAILDGAAGRSAGPCLARASRFSRRRNPQPRRCWRARGDYIVFLDGDCLVRPDFIATHRRLAERGWFVTGNRVLLSQDLTRNGAGSRAGGRSAGICRAGCPCASSGGVNRLAALLHLPLGPLRKLRPRAWRGARSCNLARLARRFRAGGRVRRRFQRLGQGGFGPPGAPDPQRHPPQGRDLRHRRPASMAPAGGPGRVWKRTNRMLEAVIAGDRVRARRGLSELASGTAKGAVMKSAAQWRSSPWLAAPALRARWPIGLQSRWWPRCLGRHPRRASWSWLWLVAALPTLDDAGPAPRAEHRRPAACRCCSGPLGVAGLLWADVPWSERLHRPVAIPQAAADPAPAGLFPRVGARAGGARGLSGLLCGAAGGVLDHVSQFHQAPRRIAWGAGEGLHRPERDIHDRRLRGRLHRDRRMAQGRARHCDAGWRFWQ